MPIKQTLERWARLAASRPALSISTLLAAALLGGLSSLGLTTSTGIDTFVGHSTASYQATIDEQRRFGSDPVVILVREPLPDLVETKDLGKLSYLEACLAGQVVVANQQVQAFTPAPAGTKPYGGWKSPCGHLLISHAARAVYGPATFLNQAVSALYSAMVSLLRQGQQKQAQVGQAAYQLAISEHRGVAYARTVRAAAEQLEGQRLFQQYAQLGLQYGLTGLPTIGDAKFISQIVFDPTRGSNQPKARFAYLFPTADSALIQVRLRSSLSDSQRAQAIHWIREAVKMPMFSSSYGGTYTVTGAPVVLNDLASQITGQVGGLLIVAVLVMAVVLLIVFRRPLPLLPLAVALAATGITFGATWVLGAPLTMASIAVLPILIGLAVDYAIQFQSRVEDVRRASADSGVESAELIGRAAAVGAPTIATAALATAVGFLVLLLSPVPMVQGFGLLLVAGIAVALVCALTAAPAALALREQGPIHLRGGALGAAVRGAAEILGDGWRGPVHGAAEILRDGGRRLIRAITPARLSRRGRSEPGAPPGALASLSRRPALVLAVGAVVALVGWFADTQTSVQSDVTKLVPASMPALRDLRTLEHVTGVSGEIDVKVRAADVTTVSVVSWMKDYQQRLLAHYGYLDTKGCAQATLCPALSLPDLFGTGNRAPGASALSQSQIDSLLTTVPQYFTQAVITPDHQEATLAFGIRLMPLARQQQVISYMQSQLHPPAGVGASLAGLPVLAAQANTALSSSARRLLTLLAGLLAVGAVLLVVFRRLQRVLVPLIPIALATGWSALIVYVIGIPLNPMSATLGALVIAISTEFSVLLSERFRQEREAGHDHLEALGRTYRSTGAAVLASGITAIAGFGVLTVSQITMLRDFGLVTLVDLTASLVGVLLVLPSVLALFQPGELRPAQGAVRRALAARTGRLRRGHRVAA